MELVPEKEIERLLSALTRADENSSELVSIDQVARTDDYLRGSQHLFTPLRGKVELCISSVSSILAPLGLTLDELYCQRSMLGCSGQSGLLPWRIRNTLGVPESLSFIFNPAGRLLVVDLDIFTLVYEERRII